jgi:dTDP-4-amino-4,6-dideoxygalactose transaminase
LEVDISYNRFEHLLRRVDVSAEDGYPYFVNNDKSLSNMPILKMSNLTQRILESINYDQIATIWRENYQYLNRALRNLNQIQFELNSQQVPMVYPFYSSDLSLRKRLIESRVYTAQYWPNVLKWVAEDSIEWKFTTNIIPLPIDRRYSKADLDKIIAIIYHEYSRR